MFGILLPPGPCDVCLVMYSLFCCAALGESSWFIEAAVYFDSDLFDRGAPSSRVQADMDESVQLSAWVLSCPSALTGMLLLDDVDELHD